MSFSELEANSRFRQTLAGDPIKDRQRQKNEQGHFRHPDTRHGGYGI